MSIGTAATIAVIMGGASAGASLYGAKKQSDAAKSAAAVQQAAAKRMEPITRSVYQQQMAGMEPYAALGRSSANTLGRLMTPGVAYTPQLQAQDAQAQANAPPPWSMDPGRDIQPTNGVGPAVPMRGQDGSVRNVPAARVKEFLNKGAVRI